MTRLSVILCVLLVASAQARNPRGEAAGPTPGVWVNVTPSNVDLGNDFSCGNYGNQSVYQDTSNPSNIYAEFNCQGIWKSTDYGQTWVGPINTGSNGSTVSDCAGVIAVSATGGVPTLYEVCIRGSGTGFWKSTDGGVDWTNYNISPTTRQDYYEIVVDPYNPLHILLSAHEFDSLVQSTDGGATWSAITLNSGMLQTDLTGFVFFINTGSSSTTQNTWLWIGNQLGSSGTWRTTNGGTSWTQVNSNQYPGATEIYQPDTSGVVYMAGSGSTGTGVLRSTDYGVTWTHVGNSVNESVVAGSSKNVYSGYGGAAGAGNPVNPELEEAAQPGTGTWTFPGTPALMYQGPAYITVVNDGSHNILLGAMWSAGLWRYIEP